MGPELVALATAAASSLVSAMTGDAWTLVRNGFGRLFGRRGGQDEAALLATLDEDVQTLNSDGSAEPDIRAQWTIRLRDLLRADPEAAAVLRDLVAEMAARGVTASGHGVAAGGNIDIRADRGGVAAGTIQGGVKLENPTQPGTGQA